MIDSSGRTSLQANGTLFDMLPIGRAVFIVGLLLVVLFTFSKPEASAGLDWPGRAVFWSLHVGTGLLSLVIASRLLAIGSRLQGGTVSLIVATGLIGVLTAAPVYIFLDHLFAPFLVDTDPEPLANGWIMVFLQEALEVLPWFLACWFLINIPVLIPPGGRPLLHNDRVEVDDRDEADEALQNQRHSGQKSAPASPVAGRASLRVVENAASRLDRQDLTAPPTESKFLLSLPGVIGTDIIAVSSDLHYLNVWTVAGRTTVLGNLRDVIAELESSGMQVHRSHWVAHRHVRRIVGNSREAACIMSNELRVAVSRRRWKAVREQYGKGVIHSDQNDISRPGKQ